jgi:hypothetical protein
LLLALFDVAQAMIVAYKEHSGTKISLNIQIITLNILGRPAFVLR